MVIEWTKHFTLILSYKTSPKFLSGGQKLALVENAYESPTHGIGYGTHKACKEAKLPYRIDKRSKLIKRIIKVWPEVRRGGRNFSMRRKRILGGTYKNKDGVRGWHLGEAHLLLHKLEGLYPLHCLAKEVKFDEFFSQNTQSAKRRGSGGVRKSRQSQKHL